MPKKLIYFLTCLLVSKSAYAYIGPGMGGGVLLAILGVIIAILIFIIGLFWTPIKKILKILKIIK